MKRLRLITMAVMVASCISVSGQNKQLLKRIQQTKGLVACWDFKEQEGQARQAFGKGSFPLEEKNGTIPRYEEGPLSGYSAKFDQKAYLNLEQVKTGPLNIHGKSQGITVMAWIKWTGEQTGFIGGMWNEYQDGGKRQYGLFASLPYYNGKNQVCGHISYTGKPTPPFPYSIDYSASKQMIIPNQWTCVAFTYDGNTIRSYLNGVFEAREKELIEHTKGFEGYLNGILASKNPYAFTEGIGNNGSDFTVGAVLLKNGMGNFFKGLIGGIAVFDRTLDEKALRLLSTF